MGACELTFATAVVTTRPTPFFRDLCARPHNWANACVQTGFAIDSVLLTSGSHPMRFTGIQGVPKHNTVWGGRTLNVINMCVPGTLCPSAQHCVHDSTPEAVGFRIQCSRCAARGLKLRLRGQRRAPVQTHRAQAFFTAATGVGQPLVAWHMCPTFGA